jgi:hypothetical protein
MPGLVRVRGHPAGFLEGRARPGSGRHGEILASFLQSDVQGDLETARMLLAETAAAARGEAPKPGGAGNAFSITISPEGAMIRNAVVEGEAPERYNLAELRGALETWIAALERARRSTAPTGAP